MSFDDKMNWWMTIWHEAAFEHVQPAHCIFNTMAMLRDPDTNNFLANGWARVIVTA